MQAQRTHVGAAEMIAHIGNVILSVLIAYLGGIVGGILILLLLNGFHLPATGYDSPAALFLGPLQALAGFKLAEAFVDWRNDRSALTSACGVMTAFGAFSILGDFFLRFANNHVPNWWHTFGDLGFAIVWICVLIFTLVEQKAQKA